MIKLDLGCGPRKNEGHIGIDSIAFDGVDFLCDLSKPQWMLKPNGELKEEHKEIVEEIPGSLEIYGDKLYKFKDDVVDSTESSHFLEHLDGTERIGFFNELYRVLKVGGTSRIVTPHWSHERAYGDPTHKFPPVCSWTYFYLNSDWRKVNAPHAGLTCNFDFTLAGIHDPNDAWVAYRNQETKAILMSRNINTVTDLLANLTKK